jgi:hypothetical protein
MTAKGRLELMFLSIILPCLRIWIYLIVKPWHKSCWSCFGLMKIVMDLVLLLFILIMDSHSVIM